MQTSDGRLIVVAGASRSGKTAYVARCTSADRRVIAWDPEDQWAQLPGYRRITTRAELLAACQTPGHGRFAFVAGGKLEKEFDFWAGVALWWGRYRGPCTAIAEELADVTTTAKAPGNWGILLRRGLKRGINIYALSQRWAEADKTAMGNASAFVMFKMALQDDVRYLAKKTGVPFERLNALAPTDFVKPYVSFEVRSGEVGEGALRFRKK